MLTGRAVAQLNTRNASTTQPDGQTPVHTVALTRFAPATQPVEEKFEEHNIEVIRGTATSNVTIKVEKDKKAPVPTLDSFIQGVGVDKSEIEKN